MSKPKAHARFAASSADRWLNCPGSLDLIDKAPPQRESAAATEGTKAHALFEQALETNVKDVVKFYETSHPLEMRRHVQSFVDYVRGAIPSGATLLIEEKIKLDFLHPTDAFGTVDIAIVEDFGHLQVIDFKYGMGRVPHVENPQLMYYALGIAHKFNYDFEKITTTIHQPRLNDEAQEYSFSVDVLLKWKETFKRGIEAANDPAAPVNEGAWCKFCPAKVICPAISSNSLAKAKLAFADPILPAPRDLSSEQLVAVLDKAAYVKLWIKEVENYAETLVREGIEVPGYGLVPKRGARQWVTPRVLIDSWPMQGNESYYVKELASPAQAEKILKAHGFKAKEVKEYMNDKTIVVSSGDKFSKTTNNISFDDLDLIEG